MSDAALSPAERSAIVRDSLAVGLATGAYGVGFGAVSVASGLSIAQTCVLSLLMFTGASQFALVGVVAAGGAPVSGAATALLLGTRNTLYGLRMAPLLRWRGWRRVAAAHVLIDESTAMGVTRDDHRGRPPGLPHHRGLGLRPVEPRDRRRGGRRRAPSATPARSGSTPPSGAAFLALLWPRLRDRRNVLVGVLAAAVALAAVPVTAAGVPVLAAGGVALLVGVLGKRQDPTEVPGPDDVAGGHH